MQPLEVHGDYYDGTSARRHAVTLAVQDGVARLRGEGVSRDAPLNALRVSEPMGAAPRIVTFPDGAYCEVRDHATMARLLAATGFTDRAHVRWAFQRRAVALAVVALIAFAALLYRPGIPLAAAWLAPQLPAEFVAAVSEGTLQSLDKYVFAASRLTEAHRQRITAHFDALVSADGDAVPHRLLFRDGKVIGANALALPDGSIVVTDQLVDLAGGGEDADALLAAVLAHELGHVRERHGLRLMLQASATGLFMAWYVGDFSALLAGAPAALLHASYSRTMEADADAYAVRMLRANGRSPEGLATMLERLEASHRKADDGGDGGDGGVRLHYLDSHPATAARIRAIRDAR